MGGEWREKGRQVERGELREDELEELTADIACMKNRATK